MSRNSVNKSYSFTTSVGFKCHAKCNGVVAYEGTFQRYAKPGLQKKKKLPFIRTMHRNVLAMRKLRDLHYELLEHPPYSPDLAPSNFCLFPKLKLFLARGDCSCRGVFCRSYKEPLQGRDNGTGASLE
jgi:hypothetical protein